MKQTILFSLIFLITTLASCGQEKKMSQEEMNRIFSGKFKSNPEYSHQPETNKLIYYAAIDDQAKLVVFEKKDNKWAVSAEEDLGFIDPFSSSVDSIEIVTVGDKPYLYLEKFDGGGSMGNNDMRFVLYDFNGNDHLFIDYAFLPKKDGISEKYSYSSENYDDKLHYLTERIKNSARTNRIERELELTVDKIPAGSVNIERTKGLVSVTDTYNAHYNRERLDSNTRRILQVDKMKKSNYDLGYMSNDEIGKGKMYYKGENGTILSLFLIREDHSTTEYLISYDKNEKYIDHIEIGIHGGYDSSRGESIIEGHIIRYVTQWDEMDGKGKFLTRYVIAPNMKFNK